MFDVERVWEAILAILLAVIGGLARLLNRKDRSNLKWGWIVSELFISGFAGIMILMLARANGLSGDWIGIVCGMAGWIGPRILDLIAKAAGKPLGLDTSEPKDKDDSKG